MGKVIFKAGLVSITIPYEEADMRVFLKEQIAKSHYPEKGIIFLVSKKKVDGRFIPVVDKHAPEEYKKIAACCEYFGACTTVWDSTLRIRNDHHRFSDNERAVMAVMGDAKGKYLEQRVEMYNSIINHPAFVNNDEEVLSRMRMAAAYLRRQI